MWRTYPRLILHIKSLTQKRLGTGVGKTFLEGRKGGAPAWGEDVEEVDENVDELKGLVDAEDEDGDEEEEKVSDSEESVDGDEEEDLDNLGLVYSDVYDVWETPVVEKQKREEYRLICKEQMLRLKTWKKMIEKIPVKDLINNEIRKLCRDVYSNKAGVAETVMDSMTSWLSGAGLGPRHPIVWGCSAYEFWDNVRSVRFAFVVLRVAFMVFFFILFFPGMSMSILPICLWGSVWGALTKLGRRGFFLQKVI
jgi:hypothetical protein